MQSEDDNTGDGEETLASFRASFSYGSRNDLNFKFLRHASDEDAAGLIQTIFTLIGDAYDTGDVGPIIDAVYEAQIAAYKPKPDAVSSYHFDEGPFTEMTMPLSEAKIGLVTSSGHFLYGDDPEPFGVKNMSQREAMERISEFLRSAPELSEIPSNVAVADLRVRHGGYDIRSAERDPNVTFPVDRLREARDDGAIGSLSETFFSFSGATAQGRLKKQLPAWIERINEEAVDAVLLVPV